MEYSDSDIHPDLQKIQKTNSLLNNLENKLNQYMSKSRIVTQRVPTVMTFVMPNIDFQSSNRSDKSNHINKEITYGSKSNGFENDNGHYKSKSKSKGGESNSNIKDLNLLDQEIKIYTHKITKEREQNNRFEYLYQQKALRLDQQIQQLSQRKLKIRNDKEILGKENRRLVEVLKQKEKELMRLQERQRKQKNKTELMKNQALQIKRKNILVEIEKEKIRGEDLEKEKRGLEYDIKLLEEKSLVIQEYQSRKTSRDKSKSKNLPKKKSASSTSKKYPKSPYDSKNMIELRASKSKSTISKKFK